MNILSGFDLFEKRKESDGGSIKTLQTLFPFELPIQYQLFIANYHTERFRKDPDFWYTMGDPASVGAFDNHGRKIIPFSGFHTLDYQIRYLKENDFNEEIELGLLPVGSTMIVSGGIYLCCKPGNYFGKLFVIDHDFDIPDQLDSTISGIYPASEPLRGPLPFFSFNDFVRSLEYDFNYYKDNEISLRKLLGES